MEECYFCCRLKPATLLKVTLLHGCFSRFLNCTNGTKSRKAPQMIHDSQDILKNVLYLKCWYSSRHQSFQSWWNGVNYTKLNISKTEHEIPMEKNLTLCLKHCIKYRIFHLISWCANFTGESPKTLWKLCVSTKFPHERDIVFTSYRFLAEVTFKFCFTCGKSKHYYRK